MSDMDLKFIQDELELSDEQFSKIKWTINTIEGNYYWHGKSNDLTLIVNEDSEIVELKEATNTNTE